MCNTIPLSVTLKGIKDLPVAPQTVVTLCMLYISYRQLCMGQEIFHAPGVLANKNDSNSKVVHVLVLSVRLLHF